MNVLREKVQARVGDLEIQLQVTRGKAAGIAEALVEEEQGSYQLEGALMEAQNTLALIEREMERAADEAADAKATAAEARKQARAKGKGKSK